MLNRDDQLLDAKKKIVELMVTPEGPDSSKELEKLPLKTIKYYILAVERLIIEAEDTKREGIQLALKTLQRLRPTDPGFGTPHVVNYDVYEFHTIHSKKTTCKMVHMKPEFTLFDFEMMLSELKLLKLAKKTNKELEKELLQTDTLKSLIKKAPAEDSESLDSEYEVKKPCNAQFVEDVRERILAEQTKLAFEALENYQELVDKFFALDTAYQQQTLENETLKLLVEESHAVQQELDESKANQAELKSQNDKLVGEIITLRIENEELVQNQSRVLQKLDLSLEEAKRHALDIPYQSLDGLLKRYKPTQLFSKEPVHVSLKNLLTQKRGEIRLSLVDVESCIPRDTELWDTFNNPDKPCKNKLMHALVWELGALFKQESLALGNRRNGHRIGK